MSRHYAPSAACVVALLTALSGTAAAQSTAAPPPAPATESSMLQPWFTGGGAYTAILAECRECEEPDGYAHAQSLVFGGGVTLKRRADLGVKIVWTPTDESVLTTTELLAFVSYRPWASRGFFVAGGLGIGWLANDFALFEQRPAARAKGLAVDLSSGWEFRLTRHVGFQGFGALHVVSLGDLPTQVPGLSIQNVMLNNFSAGALIVIR